MSMLHYTGTYTDRYQLSMAQVYFLKGQHTHLSVFDYFFRKLPFDGGYAIFSGLEDLIQTLSALQFDAADLQFLEQQGFDKKFIQYLENFRFRGSLYSCKEGDVIFPIAPVIRVEANIVEAQIIESILLNILNFQTLIATKANRIRQIAGARRLIDFGLRRAQGPASYYASRAAIVGGFDATSHVRAGRDYNIPIAGTMAHSFIQSYPNELSAFRDFAAIWPNECVLLVDTYNTLETGIPYAIQVAQEMAARGQRLLAIRLDSGDLAYLSKRARQMLDDAGLHYVKIVVSNQLDEKIIKSLLEQQAPIDIFGVGTNLVTGLPDAALDGVYKLAKINGDSCIKLSENRSKISLPGKKQVHRLLHEDGSFFGADIVSLTDETEFKLMHHPFEPKSLSIEHLRSEPLLHPVFEHGKRLDLPQDIRDIAQYSQGRMSLLSSEYKRFLNPHVYKVGLSERLYEERNQLIRKAR